MALVEELQRYHTGENVWGNGNLNNQDLYDSQVDSDSEFYLEHPIKAGWKLWKYTESYLQNDVRLSYAHPDYPWIKALHTYKHLSQEPFDYDYVKLYIDQPPGHYVVNWEWRGYYDCTDVDVFETEVAFFVFICS